MVEYQTIWLRVSAALAIHVSVIRDFVALTIDDIMAVIMAAVM